MRKQGSKALRPLLPAGAYSAYVDGSIFEGGQNAGAGWVILCHRRGRVVESGSRRISEITRGTSTIAEIYAAASALSAIGPGSHVVLYSDDLDLCHVLRHHNGLADRIGRNGGKPDLQRAYRDLFNAAARHGRVTAVKAHIDESPLIRRAHHLAREGARGAPQCGVPAACLPRGP